MRLSALLIAIVLVCSDPVSSAAVSVTMSMTGSVTSTAGFPNPPNPDLLDVTVGDALDVTLMYDPATQLGGITARVPAREATFTAGPSLVIYIERELISGSAELKARGPDLTTPLSLILTVFDPTGQAFSGPDLPTSAAPFAGLRSSLAYIDTPSPGPDPGPTVPHFTASGLVTSVPEPSAALWLVAALGLVTIAPARRGAISASVTTTRALRAGSGGK